jgi:hypothetical protein
MDGNEGTEDASRKIEEKDRLQALISLRAQAIALLTNEANGIWQRFNFFVTFHLSVLAGFFLYAKGAKTPEIFLLPIFCLFGIWFAYQNLWVLARLWV